MQVCNSVSLTKNIFSQNTASKSGGAAFQLQCPGKRPQSLTVYCTARPVDDSTSLDHMSF